MRLTTPAKHLARTFTCGLGFALAASQRLDDHIQSFSDGFSRDPERLQLARALDDPNVRHQLVAHHPLDSGGGALQLLPVLEADEVRAGNSHPASRRTVGLEAVQRFGKGIEAPRDPIGGNQVLARPGLVRDQFRSLAGSQDHTRHRAAVDFLVQAIPDLSRLVRVVVGEVEDVTVTLVGPPAATPDQSGVELERTHGLRRRWPNAARTPRGERSPAAPSFRFPRTSHRFHRLSILSGEGSCRCPLNLEPRPCRWASISVYPFRSLVDAIATLRARSRPPVRRSSGCTIVLSTAILPRSKRFEDNERFPDHQGGYPERCGCGGCVAARVLSRPDASRVWRSSLSPCST